MRLADCILCALKKLRLLKKAVSMAYAHKYKQGYRLCFFHASERIERVLVLIITLHKSILHIFDFTSGVSVLSEETLDVDSFSVATFLSQHIEKSYNETNLQFGTFLDASKLKEQILDYRADQLDFIPFARSIGERMEAYISKAENLVSTDIIVCDFTVDEKRLIGIFECTNRVGFTHQIVQENDTIKSNIIHHYAILPHPPQKLSACAFIDLTSLDIRFSDKKRSINGEDTLVLADLVLECISSISPKESVKLVNSVARKVAEKHGQSAMLAVSKAKSFVVEHLDEENGLDAIKISQDIFRASPMMQEEFVKEVKEAGLPQVVKVDKAAAVKSAKNHKIKTDTGVEILVPVEYFQNKDYIEFTNNSDGTLSITVKKIGKITDR